MSQSLTSRGGLGLVGAVFAGGLSAALFAVALMHAETLLIFLAYLTATPLFIAGLGAGSLAGLTASLAGVAGLYLTEPAPYAVAYILINALPSMILSAMALRYRTGNDQKAYWYPEGYLLTAITLYPCVIFLVIVAATAGQDGGLLGLTTQFLKAAAEPLKHDLSGDQAVQLTVVIERLVRVIPALAGCSWVFITMISMVVAQIVLQRQKWNLRTAFTLQELHIPNWLIMAAAATGLVGAVAPAPYDYIGTNLSIILSIPFFFVGLAVVHAWTATTKISTILLVAFYSVMSLVPWLAILIAALGVIDQWVNFRQRFATGQKTKIS